MFVDNDIAREARENLRATIADRTFHCMGATFGYEETIALTTGNRLWSNRSRPMLSIAEDTVGRMSSC